HDKLVVVDFNGQNPTVFTGSSNLAAGGETANGDSLAMIEDADVAGMYAIEAVAMFDHYHFRKAMQQATKPQPLTLWYPGKANAPLPWWKLYYDPTKIQLRDRCLFAGVPLPAGVATTKNVDWSAVDAAGGAAAKTPRAKAATKPAAKRAATRGKAGRKRPPAKRATPKRRPAPKKAKRKAAAPRSAERKATPSRKRR
ncbi:MAG TPA: hypothetical protein VGP50_15405, partial [Stellaceae bacterium]|nr:hypothetical protein [Stellaceae bacterium]